ncbi:hypothetical protein tpqmel_0317 [Candidatus Gastranaerophilus sp. (ex Termes propinquus)]|nr:hypothetical protein tpqmel_0317 [Candidatus Gastranaerophilus sp. (ex Termes propinquus)]
MINSGLNKYPYDNVTHGSLRERLGETVQNSNIKEGVQQGAASAKEGATHAAEGIADLNKSNPMLDMLGMKDAKSAACTLGTFGTFAAGNTLLNKGTLSKEWSKSIYGSLQKAGDTVGKPLDKALNPVANALSRVGSKIADIFPFIKTPMRTEAQMAQTTVSGMLGRTVNDIGDVLTNARFKVEGLSNYADIFKNDNAFKTFCQNKGLSATDDAAKSFIQTIKNNPLDNKKSWEQVARFFKEKGDTVKFIDNGAKTKLPLLPIHIPSSISDKIPFFQRKVNGSQIANKLQSITGSNAVSRVGKALPKFFSTAFEGVSSGHTYWMGSFFMSAAFFAQTIKDTMDAPKGEKFKTFADGFAKVVMITAAPALYAMPMNTLGGLKYTGIAKGGTAHKAAVGKYRDMLANFNATAAGKTPFEYQQGVKALKATLKGDSKWFHKPLRAIGKIASFGQESIAPRQFAGKVAGTGHVLMDKIAKLGHKSKGFAGGLMRFAVGFAIVMPLIQKVLIKPVHAAFGKPQKLIDEEAEAKATKEATKAEKAAAKNSLNVLDSEALAQRLAEHPELVEELNSNPEAAQAIMQDPNMLAALLDEADKMKAAQQGQSGHTQMAPTMAPVMSPALQERLRNNQAPMAYPQQPLQPQQPPQPAQPFMPQQMQYNDINTVPKQPVPQGYNPAAAEHTASQTPPEPKRSYVPSSEPVKLTPKAAALDQKVNSAILKADAAEERAMRYLM